MCSQGEYRLKILTPHSLRGWKSSTSKRFQTAVYLSRCAPGALTGLRNGQAADCPGKEICAGTGLPWLQVGPWQRLGKEETQMEGREALPSPPRPAASQPWWSRGARSSVLARAAGVKGSRPAADDVGQCWAGRVISTPEHEGRPSGLSGCWEGGSDPLPAAERSFAMAVLRAHDEA